MKKGEILDLIKYHYEGKESEFKQQSILIAREFSKIGDNQLSQYVMSLMSNSDTFIPQSDFFDDVLVKVSLDVTSSPLPLTITNDLTGIINATNHDIGINKFLFIGEPGTGKTQSAKQLTKLLNRELLMVDFSNLIDSKLGQTAKNLSNLFQKINSLPFLNQYVILFDEIDAIALDRINQNDSREMGRVTSTFLKLLDELNSKCIMIATTNLFENLDKALVRRFDATIDFDRYTPEDKVDVAENILNQYTKNFKHITKDKRLFKKILKSVNKIPNPGDLHNIIRSSLAFSDANDSYDYLKRLLKNLHDGKQFSLLELSKLGFSIREIEILTGISKSTVARELKKNK